MSLIVSPDLPGCTPEEREPTRERQFFHGEYVAIMTKAIAPRKQKDESLPL